MHFSRAGVLAMFFLASACSAAPVANHTVLFDAADLAAWEFVTPDKTPIKTVCHAHSDGSLALDGKPIGYLQTVATYENYHLHVEWRWTGQPGNSGVLVHIASGAIDRNLWPLCFQIQMKHTRAGDLLPMAGAKFAEKLSTPPGAKTPQRDRTSDSSEKPVGDWNSCDIVCHDGTIEATINGVLQNRVTNCAPSSGHLAFQFEGSPYELRNVRLETSD